MISPVSSMYVCMYVSINLSIYLSDKKKKPELDDFTAVINVLPALDRRHNDTIFFLYYFSLFYFF